MHIYVCSYFINNIFLQNVFSQRAPTSSSFNLRVPNIFTNSKNLLENVKKMIHGAVLPTIEKLSERTASLSLVEQEALANITKYLKPDFGVSIFLNRNLFNIRVNFFTCINFTDINQLKNSILNYGSNCIRQLTNSIRKYLLNQINVLKTITKNAYEIPRNFMNCKYQIKPVQCLSNLISNTRILAINIPKLMQHYSAQVASSFELLSLQMSVCSAKLAMQAEKGAATIGMNIQSCILKIKNTEINNTSLSTISTTLIRTNSSTATTETSSVKIL